MGTEATRHAAIHGGADSGAVNAQTARDPAFAPLREIRFAVVLYGGVSLAVYINGVVQELYNLVRATAPDAVRSSVIPAQSLTSTDAVYRRLGQIHQPARGQVNDAMPKRTDPVLRRFVVDVISGSSAGGINGVYLAKGLAKHQPISQLKQFWIKEADIADLVNDSQSNPTRSRQLQEVPPTSLLNGNRMYYKLLEALDHMDNGDSGESSSSTPTPGSLVDQLDLFVTATDLTGVIDHVKLVNGIANEMNHRHVWHLRHGLTPMGDYRDDFGLSVNPMLAFAARTTSAFPFAFAPASINAVTPIAKQFKDHQDPFPAEVLERILNRFPLESLQDTSSRRFGDGGALDNSPFTMVIDTLALRGSDVPVDRRLLYVEPDPEDLDRAPENIPEDPLSTALDLAVLLPRQQTIGEDLERVRIRNRTASRLLDHIAEIDDEAANTGHGLPTPPTHTQWLTTTPRGLSARSALHLKWRTSISELAKMIAHGSAELTAGTDDETAIELRLAEWAKRRIDHEKSQRFVEMKRMLLGLDLGYRLRRAAFVKRRADELYDVTPRALQLLKTAKCSPPAEKDTDRFRRALREAKIAIDDITRQLTAVRFGLERMLGEPTNAESLLDALSSMYSTNGGLSADTSPQAALRRSNVELDLPSGLLGFLREPLDKIAREKARSFLITEIAVGVDQIKHGDLDSMPEDATTGDVSLIATAESGRRLNSSADDVALGRLYGAVKAVNTAAFIAASEKTRHALPALDKQSDPSAVALGALRFYYERYETFDEALLPVWLTFDGELSTVEIMRVSPIDAGGLVTNPANRRQKLAGRKYGHFGAFFDPSWRRNDLLWGRLDAADILISSLLPNDDTRAPQLIREAQLRIVEEELRHTPELARRVVNEVLASDAGAGAGVAAKLTPDKRRRLVEEAIDARLSPSELLDAMSEVPDPLPLDGPRMLDTASRGLDVTVRIVRSISANNKRLRPIAAIISALAFAAARLAAGLTPRPIRKILTTYWATLAFVAGLLLFGAGALLDVSGARNAGVLTISITVAILLSRWLLPIVIRNPRTWQVVGVIALVLAIAGGGFLLGRSSSSNDRDRPRGDRETVRTPRLSLNGSH